MKFPIIIVSRYLVEKFARKGSVAFCWFMFIVFIDKDAKEDSVKMNHELIHYAQYRELWFVLPILHKIFIRYYHPGDTPFEREAYSNQYNMDYLSNRKPFSWMFHV